AGSSDAATVGFVSEPCAAFWASTISISLSPNIDITSSIWSDETMSAGSASAAALPAAGFFLDSLSFSLEGAFSRVDRAEVEDLVDFLVGIGERLRRTGNL